MARMALIVLLAVAAVVNAETPVAKVIGLLEKLSTKVESDGKRDANLYDKYACFCKEQADDKLYAIETSTKVIIELDAKINELTGEITELGSEIGQLSTDITKLGEDMAEAAKKRAAERKIYESEAADMEFAIESVADALEALYASKGKMVQADLDLAQLKSMSPKAAAMSVTALLQAGGHQPGKPHAYAYQSNDIIAVLKKLQKKFKEFKKNLDIKEIHAKDAFAKENNNLLNMQSFKEKEKAEKEELEAKKKEEKEEATANFNSETADKKADEAFMKVLTGDCEEKAREFDKRSKTRADELQAMAGAITALKEGAAPNYKANKKLVGLTQSVKVVKKAVNVPVFNVEKKPAPSFLQLAGEAKGVAAVRKALQVIQGAANHLHSPLLSAASLKVLVNKDHFVKVRAIIQNLVDKLEADALAEQTSKDFCDKEMKKAIDQRDAKKALMEDLLAQVTKEEAKETKLTMEIAGLSQGIAENAKAMKEMTNLFGVASADNKLTTAEAEAAIAAVEQAIKFLTDFYDAQGASLIQKYVPPNSDRDGATVKDLAPEMMDSEYKGEQEAGKGIIGMLNVILADFKRTEAAVADKATNEEAEYNGDKKANEDDTTAKKDSKKTKEDDKTTAQSNIVSLKDDYNDAEKLYEEAEESLENLKTSCVDGEGYKERVADREKEIAALKEAASILENWNA